MLQCFVVSHYNSYHVPTLMGLPMTLGQHYVVLPPPLMPRDTKGVVCLTTVLQQQPQSQMPPQGCSNCAMGHLQVIFSFRVEPPTNLFIFCVCFHLYFLLSGAILDALFTSGVSTVVFRTYHGRHMCSLVMVITPF